MSDDPRHQLDGHFFLHAAKHHGRAQVLEVRAGAIPSDGVISFEFGGE
jgi:hypothetical protein